MSTWALIGQQFAKILLILFIVTGIMWVIDKKYFAKQRQAAGINKKSIWLEFTADLFPVIAFIFVMRSFLFEPFKMPTSKNKITKVQIAYALVDNQGDYTPESQFPFFGMYLMLLLNSEQKNFLCTATANTKRGCRVTGSPTFDTENLTIISKEKEIKFENDQHFINIINLIEEYLKLVNEVIGEEALISNIKF